MASRAVFAARGEINPFVIFRPSRLCSPPWPQPGTSATEWPPSARRGAWARSSSFVIQAEAFDRISYLYYMLLVMPGVYLITARLFSPSRVPRAATLGWAVALVYGFIDLYPVRKPQRALTPRGSAHFPALGHMRASAHAEHSGRRAWQVRRP